MAFLAILMGMNFAACSDDDNNEGGQGGNAPGTSGKQLVWFREGGSDSDDIVDMRTMGASATNLPSTTYCAE